MGIRTNVPPSSLVVDLPRGRIDGADRERLVAVPASWLGDVLESLSDGHDAFADRLVTPIVTEAAAALEDPRDSEPEDVAWALSLAFARRGFGLAAFERRGDALVFVWRSPPASGAGFRAFAARLASRAVGELLGLPVHGVALGGDAARQRILLASPETCQRVRELLAQGTGAEAALDLLTPGDDA